MKITKHGQSCFLVETFYNKILVDPGLFVFNEEGLTPDDFQDISLIIFTHEHSDHFDIDNLKKIFNKNYPIVLATNIMQDIVKKEIPDVKVFVIGKRSHDMPELTNVSVKGFASTHGPLPSGDEPPVVSGVLITETDTGESFYHPGDTVKLAETDADVVAVPICGQVTLNIEEAKSELVRIGAKEVVPIHYDNPKYPANVKDFEKAMQNTGIEVKTLNWGESLEIE